MYTIGQFSRVCGVTIKTLRHYEKLGLLAPVRVEPENRYRYYADEQAAILQDIILMKEVGLPLKTIRRMIDRREWPDEVAAMLKRHRNRLLKQVKLCNNRLRELVRQKNIRRIKPFSEVVRYEAVVATIPGVLPQRRVCLLVPKKRTYRLAEIHQCSAARFGCAD